MTLTHIGQKVAAEAYAKSRNEGGTVKTAVLHAIEQAVAIEVGPQAGIAAARAREIALAEVYALAFRARQDAADGADQWDRIDWLCKRIQDLRDPACRYNTSEELAA